MKKTFTLAIVLLFFAFLSALFNIFSGLEMSDTQSLAAEWHLARGIASVVLVILSNLLLLKSSQTILDGLKQNFALKTKDAESKEQIDKLQALKNSCFPFSLACILLVVTSLITGTVAHPGSFPLVHGLLGFSIVACLLATWIKWLSFASKIAQLD